MCYIFEKNLYRKLILKKENKRIHDRLLMITGLLHIALVIFPGVYGEQFMVFLGNYFFNINDGLLDFPILGGTLQHHEFAAFWFFYAGPLMFIYGQLLDEFEKKNGYIPKKIAISFIVVSLIGAYMIPMSGMTFLMIPLGIYMYLTSGKIKNT